MAYATDQEVLDQVYEVLKAVVKSDGKFCPDGVHYGEELFEEEDVMKCEAFIPTADAPYSLVVFYNTDTGELDESDLLEDGVDIATLKQWLMMYKLSNDVSEAA